FRGGLFGSGISAEFQPVYDVYSECITQETENALSLLGSQGGRLNMGEYKAGNDYSPFSNQLNFLGVPVSYWYYVTGNNLIAEQVPTLNEMEREVEGFIEERINDCDLSAFAEQGFFIEKGDAKATVDINNEGVSVEVDEDLSVSKEDRSARKTSHSVEVNSNFGKLYSTAQQIYSKEKEDTFLEYYAVDVLNSYAPVDGVEVQCSPKVWKTPEVVSGL